MNRTNVFSRPSSTEMNLILLFGIIFIALPLTYIYKYPLGPQISNTCRKSTTTTGTNPVRPNKITIDTIPARYSDTIKKLLKHLDISGTFNPGTGPIVDDATITLPKRSEGQGYNVNESRKTLITTTFSSLLANDEKIIPFSDPLTTYLDRLATKLILEARRRSLLLHRIRAELKEDVTILRSIWNSHSKFITAKAFFLKKIPPDIQVELLQNFIISNALLNLLVNPFPSHRKSCQLTGNELIRHLMI